METTTETILKGELEFISLFKPIKLFVFKDEIEWVDLWLNIETVLTELSGHGADMDDTMASFVLKANPESERIVRFKKSDDGYMVMTINTVTGMSNIGAYLPDALQRLNGRKIIATFTNRSFKIEADPEDKVPEIYYTHSNSCALNEEHVKNICKPGTLDTCIFLTLGGEGFFCEKFNSSNARELLDRYSTGTMRASRVGSCAIVGRKDAPKLKPKISLDSYPDIQALIARKTDFIGWTLIDSGDSMDRSMGLEPMQAKVVDMTFELDKDGEGASFIVIGDKFNCGFNVQYSGSVRKHKPDATEIHFSGYMGHSFIIRK